jgi:hypothetical protein
MHKTFLKHLTQFYDANIEIAKKKNADYGGERDPFANFILCEELGITSTEKGILIRMTDKLSRIATLIDKPPKVKDESLDDTLKDLANYSAILYAYRKIKKHGKNTSIRH